MAKSDATLYLVELQTWTYAVGHGWTPFTAIRPNRDREQLVKQLHEYLAKRSNKFRCGKYRIATFKRTRTEEVDVLTVGKRS